MRCPTLDALPPPPAGKTGWPWTEESPQLSDSPPVGHNWPRVSIVTPSYNQGQFIEETIRSVLLQGYPDLEYIVIDGRSNDMTTEIIRRYDPWIAYWVSEPDRGQTHAINKGWTLATGDILAFINTDDYYLTGAITTAAQEFWAKPNVGMVYGTAIIVDETARELRTWDAQPFDLGIMLTSGSVVPQPATFFSETALKRVGYLNEQWQMIMDYELCIRIGMRFPTVCVPRTLARFRDHRESKSRLRFEAMVEEVSEFITTFRPDISPHEWYTIKHATMGRLHYELALYYLAQQQQQERSKAFSQLLQSIFLYSPFALARPLLTAHIVKRVFSGHFKALGAQVRDFLKRTSW